MLILIMIFRPQGLFGSIDFARKSRKARAGEADRSGRVSRRCST